MTEQKSGLDHLRGTTQTANDDYLEGFEVNQYDDDDSTSSIFDPDRESYYDIMHSLAMSWRDFS